MATLKPQHKEFIVKRLACFEKPAEIKTRVEERFQVDVTLSQLSFYNPENTQGSQQLAKKWKQLHRETRKKFIEGAIEVPISHKMYRLQQLQKLYDKYFDMRNYGGCERVLEQAAKEMGGSYGSVMDKMAEMDDGDVNFYTQISQKIVQMNQK